MNKVTASHASKNRIESATVRILSTGGTIDSSPDYDPTKKSVFSGTYLPQMLAQARLSKEAIIEALMQKDSMDITTEDRQIMLDHCTQSPENKILITHGTDTIAETARFLGEKSTGDKTVVLVGSFVPLSQPNSDVYFNLGYSVAAAQLLPAGVWVAINGAIFKWDNVKKNRNKMRFERIK